ncbi:MAG: kelch repeat-containing protein [Caldilineaceae bacterium]
MFTRHGTGSTWLSPLFRLLWVAILFLSTFLPPAQSLLAQSSETMSNDSAMDSAPQLQPEESDAPTTVVPASMDATPQTVPIDRYYGNLSAPRTFMASATVLPQKRSLLIGGQDTAGTPTSQILAVDMAGGTSTTLGNLPVALTRLAAAYSPSNDTVYTFGGDNGSQRVKTIYAINPATGAVRAVASMLSDALASLAALYHPGFNQIVLIGGNNSAANGLSRNIFLFDPTTESLTATFTNVMPSGFASVMAAYSAAVNKVFYVGSNSTSLFALTRRTTALSAACFSLEVVSLLCSRCENVPGSALNFVGLTDVFCAEPGTFIAYTLRKGAKD